MRFNLFGYTVHLFKHPRVHQQVSGIDRLSWSCDRECRPFAKCDYLSAVKMITDRLGNVEYQSQVEFEFLDGLFGLIRENTLYMVRQLLDEGFVGIDLTDRFKPRIIGLGEDRDVDERAVVYVSDDVFRATGQTKTHILRPHLDMLNVVNDSDLNLIYNYGAMGILSPDRNTLTDGYLDDKEVEDIQSHYRDHYGVRFGKWSLLIVKNPVKFQSIQLPIKELELNEKRKAAMASVLQFLNIPKELHAMFESAKYANRNEAELDMYTNCVSAWAGLFVQLLRRCYERVCVLTGKYPMNNDIWFDIVGVPAIQQKQYEEKVKAREELQMWRELRAEMPEKSALIDKRISDLIESL